MWSAQGRCTGRTVTNALDAPMLVVAGGWRRKHVSIWISVQHDWAGAGGPAAAQVDVECSNGNDNEHCTAKPLC